MVVCEPCWPGGPRSMKWSSAPPPPRALAHGGGGAANTGVISLYQYEEKGSSLFVYHLPDSDWSSRNPSNKEWTLFLHQHQPRDDPPKIHKGP